MTERCQIARMMQLTGLSCRTLQDMAARGEIPGAAKLGRRWTFDVAKVRAWIRSKEAEVAAQARASRTALTDAYEAEYERLMGRRR